MGSLPNGIHSGYNGKVGNVVGYHMNGKWFVRIRPKRSVKNEIGTPGQKACRSKFAKMQHFLGAVLPFIRIGFNLESKKNRNSAHNSAKSWNMLNAFDENGEIDYSLLRVTSGNLLPAVNPEVKGNLKKRQLVFTWRVDPIRSTNVSEDTPRAMDQVMILAVDPLTHEAYGIYSGARRSAGREVLEISISQRPGDQLHTWIAFISDDRMGISMSTYTGLVTL